MASNAVVAPRASPFLTEMGNLTPAWHHYLAQIEGLTKGLLETTQGAALAEIEAKLTELETLTATAEVEMKKRNWGFFYTEEPVPSGDNVIINHALGTRFLISRAQQRTDATYTGHLNEIIDDGSVMVLFTGGVGAPMRGWVLGFYGFG